MGGAHGRHPLYEEIPLRTPGASLRCLRGPQEIEYRIEAVTPAAWEHRLPGLPQGNARLPVFERTTTKDGVISTARLISPSDWYRVASILGTAGP